MQTITFTAASGGELRQQLLDFLGMTLVEHDSVLDRIVEAKPEIVDAAPLPEPAKPRGRPRKVVEEPAGTMGHLNDETGEVIPPRDYEGERLEEAAAQATRAASPIKDLLSVKDKTIAVLQKAMADGKIEKLRALLTEFGDGAKSFPEVAPEKFPEIAKALQNGALA
jgi:hypothetical protein